MRYLALALLVVTVCGCTYHWQSGDPVSPATYKAGAHRSADSVGRLRRLAVMPVELKSYEGKYATAQDRAAAARGHQEDCARFLTDEKGYEVVIVADGDGKWTAGLFAEGGQGEEMEDLYKRWREETADGHTPSVVQRIGGALRVDGVVVVEIKEPKPWGVAEGLLNLALVNIPLFYSIAAPDIGAWIYETATGRLVWRRERSSFGEKGVSHVPRVTELFTDLDNAVPRHLTK